MNWLKLIQMLGPILATILALLTGKDVSGIQSGVFEASATNWSMAGLTGLGAVGSALASLWATLTANKSIDYREVAVQSALTVLFARASRTGNKRLHELVSAVSQELANASQDAQPRRQNAQSEDEPVSVQQLIADLERRLRWEAARSVEGAQ